MKDPKRDIILILAVIPLVSLLVYEAATGDYSAASGPLPWVFWAITVVGLIVYLAHLRARR